MTTCQFNTELRLHKIKLLLESLEALETYEDSLLSNPAAASIHETLRLDLLSQYRLLVGEIRYAVSGDAPLCI